MPIPDVHAAARSSHNDATKPDIISELSEPGFHESERFPKPCAGECGRRAAAQQRRVINDDFIHQSCLKQGGREDAAGLGHGGENALFPGKIPQSGFQIVARADERAVAPFVGEQRSVLRQGIRQIGKHDAPWLRSSQRSSSRRSTSR